MPHPLDAHRDDFDELIDLIAEVHQKVYRLYREMDREEARLFPADEIAANLDEAMAPLEEAIQEIDEYEDTDD